MKKTSFLTIGLLVISIGLLNAQTNQGKLIVSLSSDIFGLGYTTSKTKSDTDGSEEASKSFNVNLSPKIGYFLIDNLAIGLDLGVGLQTGKTGTDNDKFTLISMGAGPFVRYYIPTSKILPFFELDGSYTYSTYSWMNTNSGDSKTNIGTLNYGGGIGLAAPLGERVMADILAGYHSFTYKDRENNVDNERTVMGTLGLSIGFTLFLGAN